MAGRDLSLTSRVEAVRETRRIPAPVLFSSEEIYNHFYESLTHIKEQFMVPMAKVEIALTTASSNKWFFEYLNNRFSRDAFLSVESMRDQLNLIGVGFVDAMAKAFPRANVNTSNKDGAKIVGELFKRRNEIAHQNDRDHATAIQNNISKEFVEEL